ncbi:MAG: YCF48-related protein [Micropepsaceae bacterium]
MRSSSKLAAALTVALTAALLPAGAVVPPKGGEAVKSKYATESLLLGVTRAGTRMVAVGEYGNIVLSDDDGKTWRQAKKVPSTVTLTAVAFIDGKTGWAVGHDTLVLHTVDGGETWAKQFGGGESDNALLSVFFKDATHGWAIGAFNYTVETTDAGKTWVERKTLMPPPPEGTVKAKPVDENFDPTAKKTVEGAGGADPYAAATGDENHLNAMFQGPDANTLFIAAEAGAVYRSLDGGVTWTKNLTGYVGSFWGGLTAKDGTVYVTGMRGNIWASKDKGATFAKLDTSGADQSIASGLQLKDGSFVFVGLGGQVLYSPDGAKYTLTYRPDRKGLNAVIEDQTDLFVFGEAGIQTQSITPKQEEVDVPLPAGEAGG